MPHNSTYSKAVRLIDQHGFLLVFPQAHKSSPQNLWHLLYPSAPFLWGWDDSADNRVADLWHLREELARSRDVVYGKFYQGRATFFSKAIFKKLLAAKGPWDHEFADRTSQEILETLEMDSPLSTKQLKHMTGLQGKMLEGAFHRALRDLWENFLIVGLGEIEDGAFPSLAYAATRVAFEDLWNEALQIDPGDAMISLTELKDFESLERSVLRTKFWRKTLKT